MFQRLEKFAGTNTPAYEAIFVSDKVNKVFKDFAPGSSSNFGTLVSISTIFYKQLFRTKAFCAAFTCLQFGFVIFRQKDFGAKAAHKMLVKSTPLL